MPRKIVAGEIKTPLGSSFASVFQDCLNWGTIIISRDGTVLAATPEAERILELSHSKTRRNVKALPEPVRRLLSQLLAESRTNSKAIPTTASIGGHRTVLVRAIPCGGSNPVVVVVQDLAPLTQIEQHLARLNRLASLGLLSANAAHEIKNALVAGKTFVDLLVEKNAGLGLAHTVRREIKRIDSIVTEILRFSKPAPKLIGPVSVHQVLDHSLRLVRPQISGKAIVLRQDFRAAQDSVKGDQHQLQQAFVNLLLNAFEAMGSHGTLTVETETSGSPKSKRPSGSGPASQLRVIFSDTGAGIAREDLRHLFEPFFTTKPAGTGLGLSITREIIQEHGGAITVQSELNKGSKFAVSLPANG